MMLLPNWWLLICITPAVSALWPQPVEIETGSQILWLDPGLKVNLYCDGRAVDLQEPTPFAFPWPSEHIGSLISSAFQFSQILLNKFQISGADRSCKTSRSPLSEDSIIRRGAHETLKSMYESTFVPWKLHKRHSRFEPDADDARHYVSVLEVRQHQCPESGTFRPERFFDGDESYQLSIDNKTIVITSNHTLGTLRGLQTLQQLFYAHSSSSGSYTTVVPVEIKDRPRWRHRGLSIDVARNPFHPRDLLRTIDAMAMAKMSRLHIHATDSQSWPLEIPALPDLAKKGAYQPHLVWTARDLEEIQAHGASKGISVFVEIDMPGHTASVAYAYPELIAAFNNLDWSTFAAEPLSGQLKLNSSSVFEFVTTLLEDLLPRTSQYSSLYHVGGDEVNRAAYLLDETVRSNDPKVLQPLLQNLIGHAVQIALQHGLQPVVWEEMLLDWNLTFPSVVEGESSRPTLVQVWRNSERIEEVLKRGHRAIFGDYHHWYLDCGFGLFLEPYPTGKSPPGVPFNTSGGFASKLKGPYLDYCNPYHNWRQMYTYNPLANISIDLQAGIEGGEALMWSEQTDSIDLDAKLWPRTAAAAEVLWSGVREESMLEDAARRLGEFRERSVLDLGVAMAPVHMTWCLMEGGCNL